MINEGEEKRSRLFRRFVKSKKPEDHQIYKAFRKKLSKQKYRARRTYYRNLLSEADNKEDKTAIWDVINKAFGKQKKDEVYPKKVPSCKNGSTTKANGPKEVANALNKHFTNVAKKLAENLKSTKTNYKTFMGRENKSSMFLKEISIDEIIEQILSICTKKAMGYDRIPPKII